MMTAGRLRLSRLISNVSPIVAIENGADGVNGNSKVFRHLLSRFLAAKGANYVNIAFAKFPATLPPFGRHVFHVVGLSSYRQMRGVAASGVVARVQHLVLRAQAVMFQRANYAMSVNASAVPSDLSVSAIIFRAAPFPTFILAGLNNSLVNSARKRAIDSALVRFQKLLATRLAIGRKVWLGHAATVAQNSKNSNWILA